MAQGPGVTRGGGGMSLSEKLFVLFIVGTLAVVFGSFAFRPEKEAAGNKAVEAASRAKMLRYLAAPSDHAGAGASGTAFGVRKGGASGGKNGEGLIVARAGPEELEAARRARRSSDREPVAAGARPATAAPENPPAQPAGRPAASTLPDASVSSEAAPATYVSAGSSPESWSVFTPSRLGLALNVKRADVWTEWADVHLRNITGTRGVDALAAAFELVATSRAAALADDLLRKGIPIAFGDPSVFTGETANVVATFDFSSDESLAEGAPATMPAITFNPAFLGEDPRVLAAALVHEATHFQQFLDGSLLEPDVSHVDLELEAWWNEAAFWDETRASTWPANTFLEEQAELAYRTALRGEAALRDLVTAIHG